MIEKSNLSHDVEDSKELPKDQDLQHAWFLIPESVREAFGQNKSYTKH